MVEWLRPHASTVVGMGFIPGQVAEIPHVVWYGWGNKTNKQTNKKQRKKLRNYLVTQESLGRILRAPGAESSGILGTQCVV